MMTGYFSISLTSTHFKFTQQRRKVRILTFLLLAALSLLRSKQVGKHVRSTGRELMCLWEDSDCWPAQFLTKKNGLL